ncbi:hypothetical protein QFW77_04480 [Luteimonas sp. RD2P54]|uniref:Integral membrane protein n=1 Tax=Luteimonas endophytica TaxID=3042023 RepID=A0ABT6J6L8_9GAMM|nr:hypothetical protein [Luteimonas endophytica]MDH5822245.1 hypothetical protein [Luteimonas endophytica]
MPTHVYPYLVALHLLAAIAFGGSVFFEVVVLGALRRRLPARVVVQVEAAVGARARKVMPWVLLSLYGSGIGLGWTHRAALAPPTSGSVGVLLAAKIALALSVFGHFTFVMLRQRRGTLDAALSRRVHLSVFVHVLAIAVLAKAMFALHW